MGKRTDKDWDPDPGEQLMGTVTDAMIVPTNSRGDTPVAVITEVGTGTKVGVWCSRQVLQQLFNVYRPAPGAEIVVTYTRPRISKKTGRTYHDYLMDVSVSLPKTGNPWIEDFVDDLRKAKHR